MSVAQPTTNMGPAGLPIELFLGAEADLRLFEPSVDGFALWPVVRFNAWQIVSGVETSVTRGSWWRRLRYRPRDLTMLPYALWSLVQRRRLRNRRFDAVFLTDESYRSVKRSDGWWDVYLDDIAAHPSLSGRVLWCESRRFAISPFRTPGRRHLFTDAQIVSQVLANRRRPDPQAAREGRRLGDIFGEAVARAGQPLTPAQQEGFTRTCIQQAGALHHALPWYTRLLEQASPRVLVVMCAYGRHAAVAAAMRMGIPVVELQHGIIHRDHPGYIWPAEARGIRERLPIPNRIATYGDFWSDLLLSGGFWQPREITSIGSVRMDWLRGQAKQDRHNRGEVRIVFTTQYATRKSAIPLLGKFLDVANGSGLRFRLTVKVHRSEAAFLGEYRRLSRWCPNVTVLSAYQGDTLSLIRDSDVHVSGWSTCHYEAVGLGTPTIVVRFPGPDRMGNLGDLPGVSSVSSARELLSCIEGLRTSPGGESPGGSAAELLFKRGAVENAVAMLSEYIEPSRPSQPDGDRSDP